MSESYLKQNVRMLLTQADAHPISVENRVHPGTPDMSYAGGWIELKKIMKWPIPGRPVRIPHFTQQQRIWLRQRCDAGGRAHLLLQVGLTWMLFWGRDAADHLGKFTHEQLNHLAVAVWSNRPASQLFMEALCLPAN